MRRLMLLAAVGGLALLGVVSTTPAQATFPGTTGLIAFGAFPTPDAPGRQIYTIEPDGTGLRQVTTVDGDALLPHWSPDGNKIVFELDHFAGEPFCSIELMNFDGSGLTDLTGHRTGCENSPSFTPDGSRIIFDRFNDVTGVERFWTMDLTGGDREPIKPLTCCGVPEVSPDGTKLSFESSGGSSDLMTADLNDTTVSNVHEIIPVSADLGARQSWAPDGSRISVTFNVDYPDHLSANVATIAPDGSDLRFLTHYTGGRAGTVAGAYSPDGQWIVFRLDQGENPTTYGLWKMRPDGSQRTLIAELPFRPRTIDWGTHP